MAIVGLARDESMTSRKGRGVIPTPAAKICGADGFGASVDAAIELMLTILENKGKKDSPGFLLQMLQCSEKEKLVRAVDNE